MKALRTPEARFAQLKDFPFQPNYLELQGGLRMHYVDEGDRNGPVVLLLHGEPTWSYLYRKMIPVLVQAGFRVLAPDLIGFGRSDKLPKVSDYSYQSHLGWLNQFMDALALKDITLFGQDWGSLLGLRLVGEQPDRFARVMISNGFLPTGERKPNLAFKLWRAFALNSPWFPIGKIVNSGVVTKLSRDEIAAYDAPFPSRKYKAATRAFPALVPMSEKDPASPGNKKAWASLGQFTKPFLCVYGKNDPVLGGVDKYLIAQVPGAKGQPHERTWGGHFVQEDRGEYLAERLVSWAKAA